MTTGRKSLPIELKILSGTTRKDRDSGKIQIKSGLTKLPPAPSYIEGPGLIYYQQQGATYLSYGILNEFNLPLFVSLCHQITRLATYAEMLSGSSDPDTMIRIQRIYNDTEKCLRLCMAEFGLSPASLSKIKLPEHKQESDLEKFLKSN